MKFQTVFFEVSGGKIIKVMPSTYIASKFAKLAHCPGYKADEVRVLYFPHAFPVDPAAHHVIVIGARCSPQVCNSAGAPLIYEAKKAPFRLAAAKFKNIIVDLADSMGDKLYRAACVIEAQKVYPDLVFFCKIEHNEREIMSFVHEITPFVDYKTHGLDPKNCATITMAAGELADPMGIYYSAPSRYGLFLGLDYVPYTIKLQLPPDFDEQNAAFAKDIGLREDGHNVAFQLRTKNEETRSWTREGILELAALIKSAYDCKIYYLGSAIDLPGEHRDIINLAGKASWTQTAFLLTKCSHRFVIDSACLHICHALDLPCFRLWGRTHPRGVLGEDPGPLDIFSSPLPLQSDTHAITARSVFERAFPQYRTASPLTYDKSDDTSQHGEQKIIFQWFSDHPAKHHCLVDVGAFGKYLSNSFGLLNLDWHGLLIEPSPQRINIVREDFKGLAVNILNIGVNSRHDKIPFYLHGVAGHDSFLREWYPESATDKQVMIDVVPLKDVLQAENIPFDFDLLTIDTEGLDEKIMKKFLSSSEYRPAMIITESTSYADAPGLFAKYGYDLLTNVGSEDYGNFIFTRKI